MARSKRTTTAGNDIPETPSIDSITSGIEDADNGDGTSNTEIRSDVIDYTDINEYVFVGYAGDEKQYRKK